MTDETRRPDTPHADHLYDLLKQERYSPQEAAEVLNMNSRIILSAAYGGDLEAQIINGDVVSVTRTALVKWLQERERR